MLCSSLTRAQSNALYLDVLKTGNAEDLRQLCKEDLFFLLTIAFKRKDVNKDWLYDRCREVEAKPNGYLDLWAREFYKSTIITYALSIQDILNDSNVTIAIFSHTRPIAKSFLEQIKRELETNEFLKDLFPDVLYREPHRESPRWSLDNGIIVKRTSNPKEATVEAWGLVDGQPTSKHYSRLVYDDVVTRESVTTPEQIKKVTDAWALSLNLGSVGGKRRYIGTRYHYNDTYRAMLDRSAAILRKYPATDNGKAGGEPVFLAQEALDEKYREMGVYIYSSQMLQDPTADKAMGFKIEWLRYYNFLRKYNSWNFYLLVDPAGEKKKSNDYTVIVVIGLAPDNNYYLVDAIRDRLNLTERTAKVFEMQRKWKPLNTGYEKYGMQSDIEHIEYEMELQNYRFKITALAGSAAKEDRVRRLVPIFEQNRFWLPNKLNFVDNEGKLRDFVAEFVNDEFEAFPVALHDDMFDCMSRIVDKNLEAKFPVLEETKYDSMTRESEPDKVTTDYDLF